MTTADDGTAVPRRPAFDPVDAAVAKNYLESRKLTLIDWSDSKAGDDVIFKASLESARFITQHSFGLQNGRGQSYRAYPFFVGKPSINAFAVEETGLQLCGMDVGLASAAFEISLFVLSQAGLFTEIGDATGEQSPTLPAGSQLAFWISDRLRDRGTPDGAAIGFELRPKNAERQRAAEVLTQLMLRFVWLHEFYYGLNGHTGLLASERPGAVFNDMPDGGILDLLKEESREGAEQHRHLRHAMEYDADRSALWMLVCLQQVDLEPIAGLTAWAKPRRLKLAIFAAAMMTFVFDQAAGRQAKQTGATHPLPQHRLSIWCAPWPPISSSRPARSN